VPSNVDLTEKLTAADPATYRRLLRVPGFGQLLISSLLTRTASQMWVVGLVLFALQRYHSPSVAGLSLFLLIFPGLLLSPIAGALLDRHGRKRLMTLDFMVAAICLTVIVVLAVADRLPVWGLYALLVGGSVTSTLSIAGARSLFPLILPRDLWDRGNAADSVCAGVANIAGPALAGGLIALIGDEAALAGAAVAYLVGAVVLQGVAEPAHSDEVSGPILVEAWRGLRYVVTNRTLRWIAIAFSTLNVGWGMVIVALPVIVFHLHGNAAVVGLMLALAGAAGRTRRAGCGAHANRGTRAGVRGPVQRDHGTRHACAPGALARADRRRHRDRRRRGCRVERQRFLAPPAPHRSRLVRPRLRCLDGLELLRCAGRLGTGRPGARGLDHVHDRARRRAHAGRQRPHTAQDPGDRIADRRGARVALSRQRAPLVG
jgi:MFS family permease